MSSLLAEIEVHALDQSKVDIGGYSGVTTNLRCSMAVVGRSVGVGDYQYWAQFVEPDLLIKPGEHQIALVVVISPGERVDLCSGHGVEFFRGLTKFATGIVRNIREAPPAL